METRADRLRKRIEKKARHGFRGYPAATVAYHGPDDQTASKVAVGIIRHEDAEADPLERWWSEDVDVRHNAEVLEAVCKFIKGQGAVSVTVTPGVWGCPHEEGVDYPRGETCPKCPFWANRDRNDVFFP